VREGVTSRQVKAELLAMIQAAGLLPTQMKNGGGVIKSRPEDGEPERLIVVSKPSRNCLHSIDFAATTTLGFSAAAISARGLIDTVPKFDRR
jgi:hypothetical protein